MDAVRHELPHELAQVHLEVSELRKQVAELERHLMSAGKESGAPASQQQPWAPDAVALGREVGVGALRPPSVCPAAGHPGSRWGRRPTGAGPWPASRAPAPVVRPHGPLVLPWRLPPGWTQCWGTAPASDLQPSQPLHREVVCRVPVEGCPLSPKQGLDCSPRGREALGLTPSQGSPREEPCLRAPPGVGGCLLRRGPPVRVPWAPVPPGSMARFEPGVQAEERALHSALSPQV